jgi:hypothetical protein
MNDDTSRGPNATDRHKSFGLVDLETRQRSRGSRFYNFITDSRARFAEDASIRSRGSPARTIRTLSFHRGVLPLFSFRFGRKAALVAAGAVLFTGCGGGGGGATPAPSGPPTIEQLSADRSSYFIGERAQVTARFSNGTARLQPGNIQVQNDQKVASLPLDYGVNELELVVTNGAERATRTITVNAAYRDRARTIDAPFARAEHAAHRLSDGRVLILGGEDGSNTLPNSLWVFDPATEQFSSFGASLATGRVGFTSTSLYNGDILVAGGDRGLTGAPSAEIIRMADRAAAPTAGSMQVMRTGAAATLLMDGKVFISGGTSLAASDTVEIYDPATGTFTKLAGRLSVGRYAHTSVRIDTRRVLIYGGFTLTQQVAPPEIYDPVAGTSTPLPAAEANLRGNHSAHTMQDGGVLIIGGEDEDSRPLASVLRFDPASGVIAGFANLATPRSLLALARLGDARVLVMGGVIGQSQSDITNTTEMLALDGVRRDGPEMNHARWLHTVTPLVDGRVLIMGGLGADRMPLASAEIYE